MNTMPLPAEVLPAASYGATRFNALRHGVLSKYAVLPWEDEAEYRVLLAALVEEHAPEGPTEEHLVEEVTGIIWRKRRLRMAEAAVFRERLRCDVAAANTSEHLASAALIPITGRCARKADIGHALAASAAETSRELRDVKRDQTMTRRAWDILDAGGPEAYARALAALRDDTRSCWETCLAERSKDGSTCAPTAEALKAWIDRHWREWYDESIAELEHRGAIREQALGTAYGAHDLDVSARYEVHLDRKLERTLAMLIRLRELRRPVVPG